MTYSYDSFIQFTLDTVLGNSPTQSNCVQVLEKGTGGKNWNSDRIAADLAKMIPSRCKVVFLDVEAEKYKSGFGDFLKGFVEETYKVLGLEVTSDNYQADFLLNLKNQNQLRSIFKTTLSRIVQKGARIILILKHYEKTECLWNGDGFGYIRELIDDDAVRLPIVVFTAKAASEVRETSEANASTSPLWNKLGNLHEISDDKQTQEGSGKDGRDFESPAKNVVRDDRDAGTSEEKIDELGERADDDARKNSKLGFIGREEYIDKLMKAAGGCSPRHLSVFGLPGLGKSEIVKEWIRRVRGNDDEPYFKGNNDEKKPFLVDNNKIIKLFIPSIVNLQSFVDKKTDNLYLATINDFLTKIKKFNGNTVDLSAPVSQTLDVGGENEIGDGAEATEALKKEIERVNRLGWRVALVLDDFQLVEDKWSEEDYKRFCMLLLNDDLDLFCVVISRPPISFIISKHAYKITPFEPFPVKSFSDEDLRNYIESLQKCFREIYKNQGKDPENVFDLLGDNQRELLKRLLVDCGKIPTLLNMAAEEIRGSVVFNGISLEKVLESPKLRDSYKPFYKDVADCMHDEEKKEMSFTHIVKCYFGVSDDYSDFLERYINELGYVEEVNQGELLEELCTPYRRFDKKGNHIGYYVTYCPGFINYLYKEELENIKDIRDLFTGLIHSLRDITEKELEKNLKKELEKRLKKELEKSTPENLATEKVKEIIPPNGMQWHELLMNCFFTKEGDDKPEHYALHKSDAPNDWDDILRVHADNNDDFSRRVTERIKWNSYEDVRIFISAPSLRFAIKALQNGGGGTEILDAISLADHTELLCKYPSFFNKYFGILGNITEFQGKKNLRDCLNIINENVRNPLSHYNRRSLKNSEMKTYRGLCVNLLKSIYSYIDDGTHMSMNRGFIDTLDKMVPERATLHQQLERQANTINSSALNQSETAEVQSGMEEFYAGSQTEFKKNRKARKGKARNGKKRYGR